MAMVESIANAERQKHMKYERTNEKMEKMQQKRNREKNSTRKRWNERNETVMMIPF